MTTKEFKAPRTLTEIQQEYQRLLVKAGQIHYQMDVYRRDIEMINEELRDMNFEAAAANKASKDAEAAKQKTQDASAPPAAPQASAASATQTNKETANG